MPPPFDTTVTGPSWLIDTPDTRREDEVPPNNQPEDGTVSTSWGPMYTGPGSGFDFGSDDPVDYQIDLDPNPDPIDLDDDDGDTDKEDETAQEAEEREREKIWPYDDPCIFPKNSKSQKSTPPNSEEGKPGGYNQEEVDYWRRMFKDMNYRDKRSEDARELYEQWEATRQLARRLKEGGPAVWYLEAHITEIIERMESGTSTWDDIIGWLQSGDKWETGLGVAERLVIEQMLSGLGILVDHMKRSEVGDTLNEDMDIPSQMGRFLRRLFTGDDHNEGNQWADTINELNDLLYHDMMYEIYLSLKDDPQYKDCAGADGGTRFTNFWEKFKTSNERTSKLFGGDPSSLSWKKKIRGDDGNRSSLRAVKLSPFLLGSY